MPKYGFPVALLALFLVCSQALAVEALPGSRLAKMCRNYTDKPKTTNAANCRGYVHGFLGGIHAAQGVMAGQKAAAAVPTDRTSFSERATQTRVGARGRQFGEYRAANFCIPAGESIAEIIDKLNGYLKENRSAVRDPANQMLSIALAELYPCRTE